MKIFSTWKMLFKAIIYQNNKIILEIKQHHICETWQNRNSILNILYIKYIKYGQRRHKAGVWRCMQIIARTQRADRSDFFMHKAAQLAISYMKSI